MRREVKSYCHLRGLLIKVMTHPLDSSVGAEGGKVLAEFEKTNLRG